MLASLYLNAFIRQHNFPSLSFRLRRHGCEDNSFKWLSVCVCLCEGRQLHITSLPHVTFERGTTCFVNYAHTQNIYKKRTFTAAEIANENRLIRIKEKERFPAQSRKRLQLISNDVFDNNFLGVPRKQKHRTSCSQHN